MDENEIREVHVGDVITRGLMNSIIKMLNAHEKSVAEMRNIVGQLNQGLVDVLLDADVMPNPDPNPILGGGALTLAYSLYSEAINPAVFKIRIRCSN